MFILIHSPVIYNVYITVISYILIQVIIVTCMYIAIMNLIPALVHYFSTLLILKGAQATYYNKTVKW